MKKIVTIIIFALSLSIYSNAQEIALPKGSSVISAGLGFVSSFSNIAVPPIYAQYEYVVTEFGEKWCVGVGAMGGYFAQRGASGTISGGGIDAMGNIHYSPIRQLDIYGGLFVGFITATVGGIKANSTDWGAVIGASYFFSDTFGLNLQIGGLGSLNVGISFRL